MKLDAEHQAGKQILKDLDAMYKAHPDWIIKKIKPVEGEDQLKPAKKGKKGKKGAAAAEEGEEEPVSKKKKRITDIEVTAEEVNPLDAA